jgi:hypothetical protein
MGTNERMVLSSSADTADAVVDAAVDIGVKDCLCISCLRSSLASTTALLARSSAVDPWGNI